MTPGEGPPPRPDPLSDCNVRIPTPIQDRVFQSLPHEEQWQLSRGFRSWMDAADAMWEHMTWRQRRAAKRLLARESDGGGLVPLFVTIMFCAYVALIWFALGSCYAL